AQRVASLGSVQRDGHEPSLDRHQHHRVTAHARSVRPARSAWHHMLFAQETGTRSKMIGCASGRRRGRTMGPEPNTATDTGEATVDPAFIRRAVELADLNAVRVALYQHTHDPELAELPKARAMDDAQRALLVDKAVAWLL